jgi:hypothetical protein
VRITRTVTVTSADDDVVVEHAIENASAATVAWAPWDVHELRGPGVVYAARRPGSPFRDGAKAFPAEGDSEGARPDVVRVMDDVVAIDCRRPRWFKFGTDAGGWALAVVETPAGLAGYRKQVPFVERGPYAHGCVVEVYNSPHAAYFEAEVHGPVATLAPGERTTLVERRRVVDVAAWPATAADVRAIAATS